MALGRHAAKGGPTLTRRAAMACAFGAFGMLGVATALGCGHDAETGGTDADAQEEPAMANLAHQTAVEGDGALFFVDFSSGSVVRTDRSGATHEVVYSNGQVNHLGIRYLVCSGGDVFFCDAPSASVRAVPTTGGDARTVLSSPNPAVLPLPLLIEGDVIYLSMLDGQTMASTLASVRCDGSDYREYFTLPSGFYAQYVDVGGGRAYYSGVSGDVRQIRSAALDGSDEATLFALEAPDGMSTSLTWQIAGDRLYVLALDGTTSSNLLTSRTLDGSDEQVVHNFSTQNVYFDLHGDDLYFIDRDALTVLASTLDDPVPQTVATIPPRAGTTVSAIEAGDGIAWVLTVTPGSDNANEYVAYMIDIEAGLVMELA